MRYPDSDGTLPIDTNSVHYPQPELGFSFSVHIRRILETKALSRVCKIDSGKYEIPSNLGAQLIFTPAKGWINPSGVKFLRGKDMAFLQKLRIEKITGIGDESDIAIIKVSPIDSNKPFVLPQYFTWPAKCAKVSFEKISHDEPIFSISYPGINRPNKVSIDEPQFTLGKALAPDQQSKSVLSFLENNFPGNDFIVSTLDAEGGSSGGGVFDIHGYIRGIIFLGLGPTTHYVSGRTISIPVSTFIKEVPLDIKVRVCQ